MSRNILIVESDPALSQTMKAELERKGFTVSETSDGKGSIELIRRQRPDLVVMGVELSAGQNGYILCGKLKKDDELKSVPIVIVGNADGFAQHRKLKTRADDYVAKPVDTTALVNAVGNLIGFPEAASDEVDESISLSDLVDDDEPQTGEFAAEEIAVEEENPGTVQGDPDLDMLDAAFEGATGGASSESTQAASEDDTALDALEALGSDEEETAVVLEEDTADSALDSLGADDGDGSADRTMVAFVPDLPPEEPPRNMQAISPPLSSTAKAGTASGADAAELRSLRAKVTELERAAREAEERARELEERTRDLEDQLAAKAAEADAAKSAASGASSKEVFALREAANKKDKEILRLKSEANEKDNEIVELRDKVLQLEQQLSETSGDMARKDAQIKTLSQKAEQLQNERRRFDQQLLAAKEEARSASAQLSTVQSELDDVRAQLEAAQSELQNLRTRSGDLESELRAARDEASELRREVEDLRASNESARREAEDARSQLDQAQIDLDAAKNQIATQATAFAEEAASLRRRISELEEAAQKHEDRLTRFYAKIKDDEKIREKTRKALAIALQLLDEQQQAQVEIDVDEPAEA
ncbi:MAG: response regulator [Myxococcaceae bacterium]|nr:response regulator [Myxococcaceae bacterium]